MAVSPMTFRMHLTVDVEGNEVAKFGDRMAEFQIEDFQATDPCMKWLVGLLPQRPDFTRFWKQRARGHSKTSDEATNTTWLLAFSRRRLNGLCCAEDREQANLLKGQMAMLSGLNPWLNDILLYHKNVVRNRFTGSQITFEASDAMSSFGAVPDFVICDEFTHWTDPQFWASVFSSFGKKCGMLTILCNAGYGRDWKWRVRELARTRKHWYFSAPRGTVAPWLSQDMLDEQKAALPPAEYRRLWENDWQETGGEFVTLIEAEACRDDKLFPRERTQADGWHYIATVDYAEKNDRTVGTVMHVYESEVYIDRQDIVCPVVNKQPTPTSWCREWMRDVQKNFGGRFGRVTFVLDKHQLLSIGQELENEGFEIVYMEFQSGIGNWKMGLALRQFILERKIHWYPECGTIYDDRDQKVLPSKLERDDLETELASLIVKRYGSGNRWRFQHHDDGVHHDDRAYGIASGLLHIVENGGGYEEFGLVAPENFLMLPDQQEAALWA